MSLRAERIIERMKRSKSPTCWDGCVAWGGKVRETFAEVIYDAKFELLGVADTPEGTYSWCAFCGLRIKHCVVLKRLKDNTYWKVGHTCVGRVGLEVTESTKRISFLRKPVPAPRKVEKPKVEEPEEMHPGIKKFLEERRKKEEEEFIREINESVKVEKKPEKKEERPKAEEDEEEDGYNLDDIFDD